MGLQTVYFMNLGAGRMSGGGGSGHMIKSDTVLRRRADARLSKLSKKVLLLLSERGATPLEGLGAELGASAELAGLAVGWLQHSRIVDCQEEDDGQITLRIHGPYA